MNENLLRLLMGVFSALNMWLCFYHWLTNGSERSMILEAMLGIILYITFLLLEGEDADDDDDDSDDYTFYS